MSFTPRRGTATARARGSSVRGSASTRGQARGGATTAHNPFAAKPQKHVHFDDTTASRGTFQHGRASFSKQSSRKAPTSGKTSAHGASNNGSASQPQNMRTPGADINYTQLFQDLKSKHDVERKQAMQKGLISDPDNPRPLSEAVTPVGICPDMCPEFERVERIIQKDVWGPEFDPSTTHLGFGKQVPDESRMVKKFRRSAAGLDEQLPSDLRPPAVLQKTLNFLLYDVVDNAPSFAKVQNFVWDRTRAIRNDFSILQVSGTFNVRIAIDCFERIARFHILSMHQMSRRDRAETTSYSHQQDMQQLDKTLYSLMQYYDDNADRYRSDNEGEFRAYCIISAIQTYDPYLEDKINQWPDTVRKDERVRHALKLYLAAGDVLDLRGPAKPYKKFLIAQENWRRFVNILDSSETSYLMACCVERVMNHVRRTALQCIWQACRQGAKARVTDWTAELLMDALDFDEEEDLLTFCKHFGIDFAEGDDGLLHLDFSSLQSWSGDMRGLEPQFYSQSRVESKRGQRSYKAVLQGLNIADAQVRGLTRDGDRINEETKEEESLFVSDSENGHDEGAEGEDAWDADQEEANHGSAEIQAPKFSQVPVKDDQSTSNPFVNPFSKPSTTHTNQTNPFAQSAMNAQNRPIGAIQFDLAKTGPAASATSQAFPTPFPNPFANISGNRGTSHVGVETPSLNAQFSFSATPTISTSSSTIATQPGFVTAHPALSTSGSSGASPFSQPPQTGFVNATLSHAQEAPALNPFASAFRPAAQIVNPFSQLAAAQHLSQQFSKPSIPDTNTTSTTNPFSIPGPTALPQSTAQAASSASPLQQLVTDTISSTAPAAGFTTSASTPVAPANSGITGISRSDHNLQSRLDDLPRSQHTFSISKAAPSQKSLEPQFTKLSTPSPWALQSSATTISTPQPIAKPPQGNSAQSSPVQSTSTSAPNAISLASQQTTTTPTPTPQPLPQVPRLTREQKATRAKDWITTQYYHDPDGGVLTQLLDYVIDQIVPIAFEEYNMEVENAKADEFRANTLCKRYALAWRQLASALRMKRQGKDRRRRLKEAHAAKEREEIRKGNKDIIQELRQYLRSRPGDASPKHVAGLPHTQNIRNMTEASSPTQMDEDRIAPSAPQMRAHMRSHSQPKTAIQQATPRNGATTPKSASASKIHSSHKTSLNGIGSQSITASTGQELIPRSTKISTTQTNYFRLKAMGINMEMLEGPAPSSVSSMSGRKRSRADSSDADYVNSHIDGSPKRLASGRSSLSIEDSEDLLARARKVRERLEEGEKWYREECNMEDARRRSSGASEDFGRSINTSQHASIVNSGTATPVGYARYHPLAGNYGSRDSPTRSYTSNMSPPKSLPKFWSQTSMFVRREDYGKSKAQRQAERNTQEARDAQQGEGAGKKQSKTGDIAATTNFRWSPRSNAVPSPLDRSVLNDEGSSNGVTMNPWTAAAKPVGANESFGPLPATHSQPFSTSAQLGETRLSEVGTLDVSVTKPETQTHSSHAIPFAAYTDDPPSGLVCQQASGSKNGSNLASPIETGVTVAGAELANGSTISRFGGRLAAPNSQATHVSSQALSAESNGNVKDLQIADEVTQLQQHVVAKEQTEAKDDDGDDEMAEEAYDEFVEEGYDDEGKETGYAGSPRGFFGKIEDDLEPMSDEEGSEDDYDFDEGEGGASQHREELQLAGNTQDDAIELDSD